MLKCINIVNLNFYALGDSFKMTVNRHRFIERVKQSFHRSEHEMEWNGYGGDLEKESKTSHKRKNADSWRGGTEKKNDGS